MDWNNPADRFHLADRLGPEAYNKAFQEQHRRSIVATVNGHDIWPVGSRFGKLFRVGGTDRAFSTLEAAKKYAEEV